MVTIMLSPFEFYISWFRFVFGRKDIEGKDVPFFSPRLLRSINEMLLCAPFGNRRIMEKCTRGNEEFITDFLDKTLAYHSKDSSRGALIDSWKKQLPHASKESSGGISSRASCFMMVSDDDSWKHEAMTTCAATCKAWNPNNAGGLGGRAGKAECTHWAGRLWAVPWCWELNEYLHRYGRLLLNYAWFMNKLWTFMHRNYAILWTDIWKNMSISEQIMKNYAQKLWTFMN